MIPSPAIKVHVLIPLHSARDARLDQGIYQHRHLPTTGNRQSSTHQRTEVWKGYTRPVHIIWATKVSSCTMHGSLTTQCSHSWSHRGGRPTLNLAHAGKIAPSRTSILTSGRQEPSTSQESEAHSAGGTDKGTGRGRTAVSGSFSSGRRGMVRLMSVSLPAVLLALGGTNDPATLVNSVRGRPVYQFQARN